MVPSHPGKKPVSRPGGQGWFVAGTEIGMERAAEVKEGGVLCSHGVVHGACVLVGVLVVAGLRTVHRLHLEHI